MRNLLNFLIKYNSWFVFAFYVLLSCVLLFRDNVYQQSVYLTSANGVCTAVNGVVSGVRGYFGLLDTNAELARRNAELEAGVAAAVQPGGSIRDAESIDWCNDHGMAMVMTGVRHFEH